MDQRPRGRPRAEPFDEQRRRVIAAARVEFSEKGYDGATVAAIATAAGVARPVVYETVGDKAALLYAVAEQVADAGYAALESRFVRTDAAERPLAETVREDLTWFMTSVAADHTIGAIVRLAGSLDPALGDPIARTRRRIEDRLTERHIDRARAMGADPGPSARLLAVLVVALAESMAFRSSTEDWPPGPAAALVVEFATGGYLHIAASGFEVAAAFDRALAERSGSPPDAVAG